jgi:hypothetical protein
VARGWESKAVEAQQAEAASNGHNGEAHSPLTPQELDTHRRKENLALARAQVKQQLEASSNPRHRQMLEAALADLDAKLVQIS